MTAIHATQDFLRNGFAFHVVDHGLGTTSVAEPLTMRSVSEDEGGRHFEPTFRLKNDECQAFMDELWRVGFRPSEGSGSAGALRQAEAHIESLKRIAFALAEARP